MYERRDVIKSKEAIKSAFLRMCWSKDIRKITVTEIINTANVSRGTFYAHFDDIYDLREKIENEIIELIFSNPVQKIYRISLKIHCPLFQASFFLFTKTQTPYENLWESRRTIPFSLNASKGF